MVETLEDELCIPPLNTSCMSTLVSPKASLIKTLLYCITLLTVMLNLLVVISISHFRQLHTTTNVFLLSLAVSDLLVAVAVMPTAVAQQSCWFMDKITCALLFLLGFILTSSSVGSMVLISVDRYVAICAPLHYSSMITPSRAKICVSLCWICSVIYNFIILKDHLSQINMFNPCPQKCTIFISSISGVVDFIVTFLGPVTVTVLLVFIVCLCPYYGPSLAVVDITDNGSSAQSWLFICNSSLNPLIYAFFYPWFRKAIKVIVSLQILQPGSCEVKIM